MFITPLLSAALAVVATATPIDQQPIFEERDEGKAFHKHVDVIKESVFYHVIPIKHSFTSRLTHPPTLQTRKSQHNPHHPRPLHAPTHPQRELEKSLRRSRKHDQTEESQTPAFHPLHRHRSISPPHFLIHQQRQRSNRTPNLHHPTNNRPHRPRRPKPRRPQMEPNLPLDRDRCALDPFHC